MGSKGGQAQEGGPSSEAPSHGHRLYCDGSKFKPALRGVSHAIMCVTTPLWAACLLGACGTFRATLLCALFMCCWFLQYGFSAAWHCVPWETVEAEILVNHLDHIGIFFMIAGSFLPLLLVLRETGATLVTSMWSAAALGSLNTSEVWGTRSSAGYQTLVYVGTGCLFLLSATEMSRVMTPRELLFGFGSVSQYTLGGIIYATRAVDPVPTVFGYHEVFHLLTCSASICTYCMHLAVVSRAG